MALRMRPHLITQRAWQWCGGGGPRWAAVPVADFGVDHTYSLDLRSDGVVDFRFDGALVRSWQDDGRLKYGTVGAGNQCAESTISSITVFQRCRVTIHIHVNGSGFDTRWNIDQLPAFKAGMKDSIVTRVEASQSST